MATTAERSIAPGAPYPALFGAALPQLPGARHAAIRRRREAGFERFMALGLPGPKSEAWKYTPLGRLARTAFVLSPAIRVARADDRTVSGRRRDALRIRQRPFFG